MDAIDKLLNELKAESENSGKSQKQQSSSPTTKPFVVLNQKSTAGSMDNLLAEIKSDYEEQDKAEELQTQQKVEQEKIRLEQLKLENLSVLKKQASYWLEQLDPFSSEGLWFERFAENYSSKLEAAIEYLQINSEV
ncbi:MAG: hypothetical protein HC908_03345 [Calothrix sp. SM1_7_51]|nr:hypothetical protein [Calothrix sp. SM1_7_51]